ncbi:hypothetical protein ZIOFF_029002 [Zingiber officinale]|uniref:Uncharacterized protein n=1 Tax=Zingiber officinale TaxID=94328 RepID=A0A8J5L3W6_ZINOF|nr:hypothetical protein ZIOFF_029002 [Zingiber officinale]
MILQPFAAASVKAVAMGALRSGAYKVNRELCLLSHPTCPPTASPTKGSLLGLVVTTAAGKVSHATTPPIGRIVELDQSLI